MLEPPGRTAVVATAQLLTPRQGGGETWKENKSYATEVGQLIEYSRTAVSGLLRFYEPVAGGGVGTDLPLRDRRARTRLPLAQTALRVHAHLSASTAPFSTGHGSWGGGSGTPLLE